MVACDFVDQRDERGKCGWILGQVRACRIVDPEESLTAVEDVARLPVKLGVRADLKPGGIVEMRAHELQREDTHANRGHKEAQKTQNGVATFSQ